MRTRMLGKASATAGLAVMTIFGVVAPALAAGGVTFIGSDVNVRSCPHLSCGVVGHGQNNQPANATCYTTGDVIYAGGYGDPYWDKVKATDTKVIGYTTQLYLQGGSLPLC